MGGNKSKNQENFLDKLPTEKRLASPFYSTADCEDAIHGRRLPRSFGNRVHQLCIIRGIRHHPHFAQKMRELMPELTPALQARSHHEALAGFTRALNARAIMNGVVPVLSNPEEIPYCIWHPHVPSKETLRALVQQYPHLIYHAARACAVGGYFDLYKELDPLPEVHVAEEAGYAQDSKGSQDIYQYILSQPVKFAIMDDYSQNVNIDGRRIAPLNGDTAVFPGLEARWAYYHKRPWNDEFYHFNITEDFCIDDHDYKASQKTPDDYFPLLYSPLPTDLPLVNKDKLFYVAAYTGDIDRFVRLKRPKTLPHERLIVIHGIYHNIFFAKWWSTRIPENPTSHKDIWTRRAINARCIMSNDLSWLTTDTPDKILPENIWYP